MRPPPPAESARDRILLVAREEFARHGFKGASVRRITAKAAVNLGAVNYHFHTKELLYTAVLMALIGPMANRVRFAALADVPPLEKIERVVRAIFEHIRRNPDLPPIMMREMAGGGELAGPIRATFGNVLPLLAGIIAEGQKDGSIRAGDPVLLALSTVAQPVYLNLARPVISSVAGVDPQDERVIEHAVATARAALRP
jgi:AcrR family transcriptional regulator